MNLGDFVFVELVVHAVTDSCFQGIVAGVGWHGGHVMLAYFHSSEGFLEVEFETRHSNLQVCEPIVDACQVEVTFGAVNSDVTRGVLQELVELWGHLLRSTAVVEEV